MNAVEHGAKVKTALVAIALAVSVWVAHRALARPNRYFMVDELVAEGLEGWEGTPIRVHGYVEAGSIAFAFDGRERSFMLGKSGKRLRVVISGPVPDNFRDQSEVVVEGELVPGTGVLAGTAMLMKCGGKYEGDPQGRTELRFQ